MDDLVVGIDIGGTKIAGGVVTRCGELLCRHEVPTVVQEGRQAVLERALRLVARILEIIPQQPSGIGIASGGQIDPRSGVVLDATDLLPGWKNLEIRRVFEERLKLPVRVLNDGCAAACGEAVFGAARGVPDFVSVMLGTGVGGGIFSCGQLVLGALGVAGSIGHMIVERGGRLCSCGAYGCLEAYASGTAIVNRFLELAKEHVPNSPLAKSVRENMSGGARLIALSAMKGDPLALEVIQEAGVFLGWGFVSIANLLNPAVIIVGGGVGSIGDLLLSPARDILSKYALGTTASSVDVIQSQLGPNSAILGAAAFFWS